MSLFDTPNQDSYRGQHSEGSAGPLMGFLDAFDASWTAQTRVHSLLAVEQGMRELEQAQIKKMRDAGLRPHASLDEGEERGTGPFGGAQFYKGRYGAAAQSVIDGGGWYTDDMVKQRNAEIEAAKKEHPDLGLMTYDEMFAKLREQSQEIERRSQFPTTTMGSVGGFLGSAAASMNPVTDPLNAATAFIGGGVTPFGRMGVQAGLGAATEALGQGLTDNENILLGRQPTVGEQLGRIALAGAGGALVQGAGEALAFGARRLAPRWFVDLPEPTPAPTPRAGTPEPGSAAPDPMAHQGETIVTYAPGRPINEYPDFNSFATAHGLDLTPHGKAREAALRTALDIDHVRAELNTWDGPRAWEVKPPQTDAAVFRDPARDSVIYEQPYQRYIDRLETVDDIARRLDPDVFRIYDRLEQERNELRAQNDAEAQVQTFFDKDEVARLERAQVRRERMQQLDYQMRDLAPLVSRAYSAAEKEWRTTPLDTNTINFLRQLEQRSGWTYREPTEANPNPPTLTEQPPKVPTKAQPIVQATTTGDAVPLAKLSPTLEAKVKLDANADAPTRVAATVAEHTEIMNEKVEGFVKGNAKIARMDDAEFKAAQKAARDALKKAKTPEEKAKAQEALDEATGITLPDGSRIEFDTVVPLVDEDGAVRQVSLREFLREMDKDQQALQSVMTCSRPG